MFLLAIFSTIFYHRLNELLSHSAAWKDVCGCADFFLINDGSWKNDETWLIHLFHISRLPSN